MDPEVLRQAETLTANRMTQLAAKAADAAHSHQMFLAAVDAEMRMGSSLEATTKAVTTVCDFLVTLAHESLLVETHDSYKRAVRLLDLRLELDHEFSLWRHLHNVSEPVNQSVFAAAVARTHANPSLISELDAPTSHVLLIDPLLLQHAAQTAHEQDLLVAVHAANPSIQLYELLTVVRATALPQGSISSQSLQ